MKNYELTEFERESVVRALVSMMHIYETQAQEAERKFLPTIAKRNRLEADKYKELLERFEQ